MNMQGRLSFAAALAREAGTLARDMRAAHGGLTIDAKGPQDFVTAADLAVESLIRTRLAEHFPQDAIIGEEGGRRGDTSSGEVWIIDPIDGTTNFLRGMPDWAVSIACASASEIVLGVIFAPDLDLLCEGLLSGAPVARKNGVPLQVDAGCAAAKALIAVGWSPRTPFADHAAFLERIVAQGGEFRRSGAATIGLIGVASGWVDAYAERELNLWDAAAGIAIIKAAGGTVVAPAFTPELTAPAPFLALARADHELAPLLRDNVLGDTFRDEPQADTKR
ncbi:MULTISPECIES: inositol monophosphatase family protein [Marinovum]|jgi:myo-inositol-1(or 4)-monophosphatase|uniref:Inositol-1-monophosphatase n=2 Tax=Marinovum TaxID=367771 RepID=A0A975WFR2_9RHOB|nr:MULTISPECIES: inositol monophosphatase [Marinovum]MDD9740659.1 inositol monophosphatase [Marinovum sp. SP66]SEK11808.1 myo-inositol-1(or 4)-monophosphatase [Marinovum algicola]SLN77603.1 Inositol-1-monophosphatase [Marinovum algicola]